MSLSDHYPCLNFEICSMAPIVSFVLVTHNRPQHLARAIRSVVAQGEDVEIVVVADEGKQETRVAAAKELRASDIFISRPGMKGPAESRNMGVRFARGSWICFLDDDDTVESGYISQIKPHLDDAMVTYCNFEKFADEDDLTYSRKARMFIAAKPIHDLEVGNFIPVGSFFVPRHIALCVSFDPLLPAYEDWDYLLQLHKISGFRHARVKGFRYHQSKRLSRSNSRKADVCADLISIYRRHPASSEDIYQLRRLRLESLNYVEVLRSF